MGAVKENFRSGGRKVGSQVNRVIKKISGRSILSTGDAQVTVKRVNGHETSFVARGTLHTSSNETNERILHRIIQALVPSRTEQSDQRISRHGKAIPMGAISYTEKDLSNLPRSAIDYIDDLERKVENCDPSTQKRGTASSSGAFVPFGSKHGAIVKFGK